MNSQKKVANKDILQAIEDASAVGDLQDVLKLFGCWKEANNGILVRILDHPLMMSCISIRPSSMPPRTTMLLWCHFSWSKGSEPTIM